MAWIERRLELNTDLASGQVTSGAIGANAIISGNIGSGAVGPQSIGALAITSGELASGSLPFGKLTGLMDTIIYSGAGSQSGASVAVSGIALASGSFTPRGPGRIIIQADAYANSIASGSNVTFWVASGLSGQAGAAIFASGWQFPAQTFVATSSGVQVTFGITMIVSGLTAGTAYPVALLANNMNSGTGTLLIQEILQ